MKETEISYPAGGGRPDLPVLKALAAEALGVKAADLSSVTVLKRSLDARGSRIVYRCRVQAFMKGEEPSEPFFMKEYADVSAAPEVIIAGAGPAGLFAALKSLQEGIRPIIIERGEDVHKRKYDIAAISRQGVVNPDSNYCFGEGGAGAFSDGKLYTRSNKRGDVREVLHQLVLFGADPSILTDAHPHIGSDKLPGIMENIRRCIEEHGGEYRFSTRVTGLERTGNGWMVTCVNTRGSGAEEKIAAGGVILATGHSATDIYALMARRGWELEAKGFALGVRAEHPQSLINDIQYHGRFAPYLPAAEYSLVSQVDGRGVFSFCMCPGGILVPSATRPGTVVLNGMSNSRRNSPRANAGIVVSVEPEDLAHIACGNSSFLSDSLSRGTSAGVASAIRMLQFQESVERRAYEATLSQKAPAQRMTDFVKSRPGKSVLSDLPGTSYAPGAVPVALDDVLPDFVAARLRKAFPLFDRKMHGYYTREALLLAVESRTSSPVRIPRDPETLCHISLPGLYPCGEGAGYSGGIVSSAIDGIRCAEKAASAVRNRLL